MSSFLFSVTSNQKTTLKNKNYAIYGRSDLGPTFGGGHDLCICDKADKNKSSCATLGVSYFNSN
jgi:hypothetical protein